MAKYAQFSSDGKSTDLGSDAYLRLDGRLGWLNQLQAARAYARNVENVGRRFTHVAFTGDVKTVPQIWTRL